MSGRTTRKIASLIALAVVIAVAYAYDLWVLDPLRRHAGNTFDPVPLLWVQMTADVLAALALLGLAAMLFRWVPPSRVTGIAYLVAGLALTAAWPLAAAFNLQSPGFAALNLYFALGEGGSLLAIVGPFVAAIGLVRFVLPVPALTQSGQNPRPAH